MIATKPELEPLHPRVKLALPLMLKQWGGFSSWEHFSTESDCQKAQWCSEICMLLSPSLYCLLAAQQANKSRDELLGQGTVSLFGEPADREYGRLVSQRTLELFPELQFRLLLC